MHLNILDAVYFTVTTLSTVGYGDTKTNLSTFQKFAMGFLILTTVGFTGSLISNFQHRKFSENERMRYNFVRSLNKKIYGEDAKQG